MDLSALLPVIEGAVGLDRLRSRMSADSTLTLGVSDGAKAAVLAALARDASQPILVITPKPQHAEALVDELQAWLGDRAGRVLLFPERDALPYERLAPDPDDVQRRLAVLDALTGHLTLQPPLHDVERGSTAGDGLSSAPIVVACAAAIAQRTLTPDELARATVALTRGGKIRQDGLLLALDAGGYRIEPQVSAPGEASRRGGIVDVWPPAEELPLRIELFGDEVESIRSFDPVTQRSSGMRDAVRIGPAREMVLDHARMQHLAGRMQVAGLHGDVRERFDADVAALRGGDTFSGDEFYAPFLAAGTLLGDGADDGDDGRGLKARATVTAPDTYAAGRHDGQRDGLGRAVHARQQPRQPRGLKSTLRISIATDLYRYRYQ